MSYSITCLELLTELQCGWLSRCPRTVCVMHMRISHLCMPGRQHAAIYRKIVRYSFFLYCYGIFMNDENYVCSKRLLQQFVVSAVCYFLSCTWNSIPLWWAISEYVNRSFECKLLLYKFVEVAFIVSLSWSQSQRSQSSSSRGAAGGRGSYFVVAPDSTCRIEDRLVCRTFLLLLAIMIVSHWMGTFRSLFASECYAHWWAALHSSPKSSDSVIRNDTVLQ